MPEKHNTAIEWTHGHGFKGETWNVFTGCDKVSLGCARCYAERDYPRVYPGRPFTQVLFHEDRIYRPLFWKKPRMVFVNSMSDFFHESISDDQIGRMLAVMATTPRHVYQVLTKRPMRMQLLLNDEQRMRELIASNWPQVRRDPEYVPWPLPRVWFGVSVENQATADDRIQLLQGTVAATRFLSIEPLLDQVRLSPIKLEGIDWVIVGGESGPGARVCFFSWLRHVIGDCRAAGVPVFVKQVGAQPTSPLGGGRVGDRSAIETMKSRKGSDPEEWPEDLRVREWPRGVAGGGASRVREWGSS